jgi:hypothetical protein
VPDAFDLKAFAELLARPSSWTPAERRRVEVILVRQRDLVRAAHAKDRQGRRRLLSVVKEIETAIALADNAGM